MSRSRIFSSGNSQVIYLFYLLLPLMSQILPQSSPAEINNSLLRLILSLNIEQLWVPIEKNNFKGDDEVSTLFKFIIYNL